MSEFQNFINFLRMDADEREEHITDMLASVSEVWIDDTSESIMVRGMISSMRAFLDSANEYAKHVENGGEQANPHVGGIYVHAYGRMTRDFATLSALTDVKKSLGKKKSGD